MTEAPAPIEFYQLFDVASLPKEVLENINEEIKNKIPEIRQNVTRALKQFFLDGHYDEDISSEIDALSDDVFFRESRNIINKKLEEYVEESLAGCDEAISKITNEILFKDSCSIVNTILKKYVSDNEKTILDELRNHEGCYERVEEIIKLLKNVSGGLTIDINSAIAIKKTLPSNIKLSLFYKEYTKLIKTVSDYFCNIGYPENASVIEKVFGEANINSSKNKENINTQNDQLSSETKKLLKKLNIVYSN